LCGPGEVPGLGDGHEVLELLELHGPILDLLIGISYGNEPHHVLDRWGPSALASDDMALATRTDRRPSMARSVWDSTVGKKTVMAVRGLIMLQYLGVHMI